MGENEEKNVKGEILLNPPVVVEWKIPEFFSFPTGADFCINSPSFPYLDGKWSFQCYPNGEKHLSSGCISIYLVCEHSSTNRCIDFRMGIKRDDGREYWPQTRDLEFVREGDRAGVLLSPKMRSGLSDAITFFALLRSNRREDAEFRTILFKGKDAATETNEDDFRLLEGESHDDGEPSNNLSGADKLLQNLKSAFISGDHHDTIINVQGQEFQTHKLILALRSPVFAAMFSHDTIERNTSVITIEDCAPEVFKDFLAFLYSGKVESIYVENVMDLYYASDKYQVDEIKSECLKFMLNNLSVESICDYISLAVKHNERSLLDRAMDFFVKNVKNIIVTVRWQHFHKEYPVESNELYIKAINHLIPD